MKTNQIVLALVFFLSINSIVLAQTIYGRVYDTTKDKPLSGATVYLNGTTIGTLTDFDGNFLIKTDRIIEASLIISYVGYATVPINKPYRDEVLEVVLKPKLDDLSEVVVKTGKEYWSREKMLAEFKRQFLGKNRAGELCFIINEDALDLWMDPEKRTLYASSDDPIVIRNNFLGYEIAYKLDRFEAEYRSLGPRYPECLFSFYEGVSFYKDITKNKASLSRFEAVRHEQYLGSVTHFFRSLQQNELDFEGWKLSAERFNLQKDLVFHKMDLEDHSVVIFKRNFYFKYKNEARSYFFKYELGRPMTVYLDGNYSPARSVRFDGPLAEDRIGSSLPLDYSPATKY